MSTELDIEVLSLTLKGYADVVSYTGEELVEIARVAQESGNYRVVSMIDRLTLKINKDIKEMLKTIKG